ncbi:hypothetical protein BU15DRAFT_83046 [Melanogaster broomeanus]|nr:hypothetical protein BU15DRAFT_83046 [Melanogaster broomeanus]
MDVDVEFSGMDMGSAQGGGGQATPTPMQQFLTHQPFIFMFSDFYSNAFTQPIEDALPEGVREAAADCQKAGVAVKVCTGDNVLTARSIASQCAIFTAGGVIMQGHIFHQLNDKEMLDIVPSVQILARSSPEDKKILVEKLRALGDGRRTDLR